MNQNRSVFQSFTRFWILFLNVWFSVFYSNSQVYKNKDVQTFYHIKKTSERRYFIINLRDHYLNQQVSAFQLNYRLEKANRLLNNECDRIDLLCARINILIFSDQVKKVMILKDNLEQKIEKQPCDTEHWISSKLAISNVYFVLKDHSSALKGYFSVLLKAKQIGDFELQRDALCNIGNAFIENNKIDSAEHYYNAALKISYLDQPHGQSEIFMGLSRVCAAKKQYKKALTFLNSALKCALTDSQKAFVYFHFGRLHQSIGEKNKMLSDYQNSIKFSNNNLMLQSSVYLDLETFHKAAYNFSSAYTYLKKRDSINALINLENQKLVLDSLNFSRQLNRAQLLRNKMHQKLNFESNQKRLMIIFLAITTSLLISVGYLLFLQRKKNLALVRKHIESFYDYSNNSLEIAKVKNLENKLSKDQKNEDIKIPKELVLKLEKTLMEKELYKDPNLSIQKLAQKLDVSNELLSKAINVYYGMPFRTLINKKRIELAMILLVDEQFSFYSIEGIAKSVGYNNMATFYNNFKLIAGVTPAYFQSRGRKILAKHDHNK